MGTQGEAKGRAWPGKPCNEREKGHSLAERFEKIIEAPARVREVLHSKSGTGSMQPGGLSSFLGAPKS